MPDMTKNEKQIAEAMNEWHWRAWIPTSELATHLKKRESNVHSTLNEMTKSKFTERKILSEGEAFRLTPAGRLKIK